MTKTSCKSNLRVFPAFAESARLHELHRQCLPENVNDEETFQAIYDDEYQNGIAMTGTDATETNQSTRCKL